MDYERLVSKIELRWNKGDVSIFPGAFFELTREEGGVE
jgi:hypothetical protein